NTADASVVYARRLAEGESWDGALAAEPAPRRAALAAVLSQLRLLRAASFVQDGFPEKIFAAGEVRPWRYRLDATISLPDGAGGSQVNTMTLWFAERTGASEQLAGSKDFATVFSVEQPLLDALWVLTQP